MKKLIASLLIYVLMGTQAFGFTTNMPSFTVGQNYSMTSLWNPFGALSTAYNAVYDYIAGDDEEEEASVMNGDEEKEGGFTNFVSNAWYGFTDLFKGKDQYQCSVTSSGGTCVTCDNIGIGTLAPIERSLSCGQHGLKSLDRQKFVPKDSCNQDLQPTDPKFKTCADNKRAKKKHCQKCLEKGNPHPNPAELEKVLKLAAQQRKEKIIEQSTKDFAKIATDAYEFDLAAYREGVGENFLCKPGKMRIIKQQLQAAHGVNCSDESMAKFEKTLHNLHSKCQDKNSGEKNCPAFLSSPIPQALQARISGPLMAGQSEDERPTIATALAQSSEIPDGEKGPFDFLMAHHLNQSKDVGLKRIIDELNAIERESGGSLNKLLVHGSVSQSRETQTEIDPSQDQHLPLYESELTSDAPAQLVRPEIAQRADIEGIRAHAQTVFDSERDFGLKAMDEAYEKITQDAQGEGMRFLELNREYFNVQNMRANLSKVFQKDFTCNPSDCRALMTFLSYEPAAKAAIDDIANEDVGPQEAILEIRKSYTLKVKQDIPRNEKRIEELKNREIPLFKGAVAELESDPKSKTDPKKIKDLAELKKSLSALEDDLEDRINIIPELRAFAEAVDKGNPIDPTVFNNVTNRMNDAKKEDLTDRCADVIHNFAQICKMENRPQDYKASDLIGLDFRSNEIIASQVVGDAEKDPAKRAAQVEKITQMLDKVACFEQNYYEDDINNSSNSRTFTTLQGKRMSCTSPKGIYSDSSRFADFTNNPTSKANPANFTHFSIKKIGMCPSITETQKSLVEVALAMISGVNPDGIAIGANDTLANGASTVVSKPEVVIANTIASVKKSGSRYAKNMSSGSVKKLLAAAGGSGSYNGPSSLSIGGDKNESTYSAPKEVAVKPEEVQSEVQNALNNVANSSVGGVGNVTNEQMQAINDQILKDSNIIKSTEEITQNEKAIANAEDQFDSIKRDQQLLDDGPEKSAMDAKLAELAKQIEELKAQNAQLKSDRDREIARIRNEKIQEKIVQNNIVEQNNLASNIPNAIPTAGVSTSSSSSSGNVSSNSVNSGAGFASIPTGGVGGTGQVVDNDSSNQSGRAIASSKDSVDASGNQGITLNLAEKKLVGQNGQIIAAGDDLLIVDDNQVSSLDDAKALALKKSKQAFVYKELAYVKLGEDFLLASQAPRARQQMAEVRNLRQVEELISFIDNNDPFPSIMADSDDPEVADAIDQVEELIQEDTQKELKQRIRVQYANLEKELNRIKKRMQ